MVMKDPMTNKSRGFGFLTFLDPRNVDAVLKEDHHLDGKMVLFFHHTKQMQFCNTMLICHPPLPLLAQILTLFFLLPLPISYLK